MIMKPFLIVFEQQFLVKHRIVQVHNPLYSFISKPLFLVYNVKEAEVPVV